MDVAGTSVSSMFQCFVETEHTMFSFHNGIFSVLWQILLTKIYWGIDAQSEWISINQNKCVHCASCAWCIFCVCWVRDQFTKVSHSCRCFLSWSLMHIGGRNFKCNAFFKGETKTVSYWLQSSEGCAGVWILKRYAQWLTCVYWTWLGLLSV